MGIIRILSILLILSVSLPASAKWSHKEETDATTNDTNYFYILYPAKGKTTRKILSGLLCGAKMTALFSM